MQESPKRNQETRLQTQSKTLHTQGENLGQTKDSATRIKKNARLAWRKRFCEFHQ